MNRRKKQTVALMVLVACLNDCAFSVGNEDVGVPMGVAGNGVASNGMQVIYVNSIGYSNKVEIKWQKDEGGGSYEVHKKNLVNSELYTIKSEKNVLIDDLSDESATEYFIQSAGRGSGVLKRSRVFAVRNNKKHLQQFVNTLKKSMNEDEIRSAIVYFYNAYSDRVVGPTSLSLGDNEKKIVFSMILAHNIAPYGVSQEYDFLALIREDKLDCDNYCILTDLIYQSISESKYAGNLIYLGFNHNTFGNHAQLLFVGEKRSFLLDPMVGVVANIGSYKNLINSHPVLENNILDFYSYYDDEGQDSTVMSCKAKIIRSLAEGLFNYSDVLYTCLDLVSFYKWTDMRDNGPVPTDIEIKTDIISPQRVGAQITFIAHGAGGIGKYDYMFWIMPPDGPKEVVQSYSLNNIYIWKTSGLSPGVYYLDVFIRNWGTTGDYQFNKELAFVLEK
ncbi:MAG: hypothetical protein WC299_10775 [Kiritimatiellia bacterium]